MVRAICRFNYFERILCQSDVIAFRILPIVQPQRQTLIYVSGSQRTNKNGSTQNCTGIQIESNTYLRDNEFWSLQHPQKVGEAKFFQCKTLRFICTKSEVCSVAQALTFAINFIDIGSTYIVSNISKLVKYIRDALDNTYWFKILSYFTMARFARLGENSPKNRRRKSIWRKICSRIEE